MNYIVNVKDKEVEVLSNSTSKNLAENSCGVDFATFNFDNTWDGLSLKAVFFNSNVQELPVEVPLFNRDTVEIPPDMLKRGVLSIGAVGLKGVDVVKASFVAIAGKVNKSANVEARPLTRPEQQLLDEIYKLADKAVMDLEKASTDLGNATTNADKWEQSFKTGVDDLKASTLTLEAVRADVQSNANKAHDSAQDAFNLMNKTSELNQQALTNAGNAQKSASEAALNAKIAVDSELAASNYASDAGNSATQASKSAGGALKSATDAGSSADSASQSANSAKTSEDNAKASEQSASQSASSASTSATQAVNSATQAGNSAKEAKQAETNTRDLSVAYEPKVNEAVKNANAMAQEASNVDIDITQGMGSATVTITDRKGVMKSAKIDTHISVKDWGDVQMLVRDGRGPELFPIGHTFNSTYFNPDTGKTYDLPWHVCSHRKVVLPNGKVKDGMILQSHYLLPEDVRTDYYEAFYHATEPLPVGTYHIVFPDAWSNIQAGKTYSFTLTKPLPKDGVLTGFEDVASYADIETRSKVSSFESNASLTPIETVNIRRGAEGVKLGDITTAVTPNLNSVQRISYGYNSYKDSFVRQFLNSEGKGFWKPQNPFDRPPQNVNDFTGFISSIDSELLKVISPVKVQTARNNFDNSEIANDITYEKCWLPSLEEMYIGPQRPGIEGNAFEYWKEIATEAGLLEAWPWYKDTPELVHLGCDDKQPHYTWLRSANVGSACYQWTLYPSGGVSNSGARYGFRVAPLVCIV